MRVGARSVGKEVDPGVHNRGLKLYIAMLLLTAMCFWASPAHASGVFMVANWKDIHEGINRAFTENTRHGHTPAAGYLAPGLLAVLVLVAGALWLKTRIPESRLPNPQGSSPFGSSSDQRRNWVRVPAGFDCLYTPATVDRPPEPDPDLRKARLIDISGGGLLLATTHKLQPGDSIRIVLPLGSGSPMLVPGRVVRIVEPPEPTGPILAGIEFTNLSEGARDRITKWVFARQQKLITRKNRIADGLCLMCGKPLGQQVVPGLAYCAHCLTYEKTGMEEESQH